jgi:hypothetical protein
VEFAAFSFSDPHRGPFMRMEQAMSSGSFSVSQDPRAEIKTICNILGVAGVLVGFAWALQACAFDGYGAADASWIILSGLIAGAGAGFLLIAHGDVI